MGKFLRMLIGSVILAGVVLGAIALVGAVSEWLMADSGRYVLGMGILGYIVYRCFKAEFGE